MTTALEYIWMDAKDNFRSKIKIVNVDIKDKQGINGKLVTALQMVPIWTFDGSSTGQANGTDSDVLLKPVYMAKNPFIAYCTSYIVLCECYNKDKTPHITNTRIKLIETFKKCEKENPLFGFEQEYILLNKDGDKLYNWINNEVPTKNTNQCDYYCSTGSLNCIGRDFSNIHLELCLKAGLLICGTNAEVVASQWEYQIGPLDPVTLSDQVNISRYLLHRVSEIIKDCVVTLDPKPIEGWNGSGGHINYSTEKMREPNGIVYIVLACEKLTKTHEKHMKVYGKNNEKRMSGLHETSSMDKFSWGVSDRGKSIRIPLIVNEEKCGYLEDRRPASNVDLYLATEALLTSTIVDM